MISLILKGKGFNLFRKFGSSSKHETLQNPASSLQDSSTSNIQVSNPNWFISLFTYKRKTSTEQGFSFVLLLVITFVLTCEFTCMIMKLI